MSAQERPDGRKHRFYRLMRARNVPPHQIEVAWGVVHGLPDKDIATRLGVKRDTVKQYKRPLYATFECNDRGDLAQKLWQLMGEHL